MSKYLNDINGAITQLAAPNPRWASIVRSTGWSCGIHYPEQLDNDELTLFHDALKKYLPGGAIDTMSALLYVVGDVFFMLQLEAGDTPSKDGARILHTLDLITFVASDDGEYRWALTPVGCKLAKRIHWYSKVNFTNPDILKTAVALYNNPNGVIIPSVLMEGKLTTAQWAKLFVRVGIAIECGRRGSRQYVLTNAGHAALSCLDLDKLCAQPDVSPDSDGGGGFGD